MESLASLSADSVRWWLLDATGAMCLILAGAYSLRLHTRDSSPFWLLAGRGLIWLGLDELLGIHEGVGMLMEAVSIPHAPVIDDHNDVVLVAYVLAGASIVLRYLNDLMDWRPAGAVFLLAGVFTGMGLIVDGHFLVTGAASRVVEESIELLASVTFFAAFHLRYMHLAPTVESMPERMRPASRHMPRHPARS